VPAFAAFTPFATVGEEGFPKTVRVFGLGVIWVSVGVEFQSVALWFLQRPKGIKTNRIGASLDLPELRQPKRGTAVSGVRIGLTRVRFIQKAKTSVSADQKASSFSATDGAGR
jgi:hypothetical protein